MVHISWSGRRKKGRRFGELGKLELGALTGKIAGEGPGQGGGGVVGGLCSGFGGRISEWRNDVTSHEPAGHVHSSSCGREERASNGLDISELDRDRSVGLPVKSALVR